MAWKHGRNKPVIGIVGGIGSGKSTIARLFGREGCAVIDSDAIAHEVLQRAEIRGELEKLLGGDITGSDGRVDRNKVGKAVFTDKEKLRQLNGIMHPRVAQERDALMKGYMGDEGIRAIVWDTPLLMETGLNRECDAVVFVKVPWEIRLERVREKRGWGAQELHRRENLQIPLDNKAQLADYYIDNSADQVASLSQVQQVLSHLLAKHC